MAIQFLGTPSTYLDALQGALEWATSVDMAFAWASASGPQWAAVIENASKIERVVLGTHFDQTDPMALRELRLAAGARLRVASDGPGVFHPKVLLAVNGADARVVIGSANLTGSAFGSNTEFGILWSAAVDDPEVGRLRVQIAAAWERSRHPDDAWLLEYEEAHRARSRDRGELERILQHLLATGVLARRTDGSLAVSGAFELQRSMGASPSRAPVNTIPAREPVEADPESIENQAAAVLFKLWVEYEQIGPSHPLGYPNDTPVFRPVLLRKRRGRYAPAGDGDWSEFDLPGRELWVFAVGAEEVANVATRLAADPRLAPVSLTWTRPAAGDEPSATELEAATPWSAPPEWDELPWWERMTNIGDRWVVTVEASRP